MQTIKHSLSEWPRRLLAWSAAMSLCPAATTAKAAAIVELDAVITSGFYDGGIHFPHHMNYFVGYSIPSSPVERRNFFVFNLADIEAPILGAKLKLYLPGGEAAASGYISSDPHETYRISGSPFPALGFMDAFFGKDHITPPMVEMMYGSLGSAAPSFGMTMIGPDFGGADVTIDLNAEGIAALNAALGSLVVLGGRLTDLHLDSPGMPPSELVFAYTDVGPTVPMPRLELVMVPEPSTAALLLGGLAIGAAAFRRRQRHG